MKLLISSMAISWLSLLGLSSVAAQFTVTLPQSITSSTASNVPTSTTAEYTVRFDNTWLPTTHSIDYPISGSRFGRAHWSPGVVASHNNAYNMWANSDGTATPGTISVAETGGTSTISSEISAAGTNVLDSTIGTLVLDAQGIDFPDFEVLPGTLSVDASHSIVSSVSMIAPSPDWFSGVYNLNMVDSSSGTPTWYRTMVVETYAFDAGSDSGTTYRSSNSQTNPREEISNLGAAGEILGCTVNANWPVCNVDVYPVLRWTFTLTNADPPVDPPAPSPTPITVQGIPSGGSVQVDIVGTSTSYTFTTDGSFEVTESTDISYFARASSLNGDVVTATVGDGATTLDMGSLFAEMTASNFPAAADDQPTGNGRPRVRMRFTRVEGGTTSRYLYGSAPTILVPKGLVYRIKLEANGRFGRWFNVGGTQDFTLNADYAIDVGNNSIALDSEFFVWTLPVGATCIDLDGNNAPTDWLGSSTVTFTYPPRRSVRYYTYPSTAISGGQTVCSGTRSNRRAISWGRRTRTNNSLS